MSLHGGLVYLSINDVAVESVRGHESVAEIDRGIQHQTGTGQLVLCCDPEPRIGHAAHTLAPGSQGKGQWTALKTAPEILVEICVCAGEVQVVGDKFFIILVAVGVDAIAELLEIAEAGTAPAPLPGLLQGRQEHGGKNSNYCDHDQKFNQRER